MKISIARIFPSNFISHKGVKTNEISQSILISSSLQKNKRFENFGEKSCYFVSSPFSRRFRALDKRFRRRVRISSIVDIRKNSPNDSTPCISNSIKQSRYEIMTYMTR